MKKLFLILACVAGLSLSCAFAQEKQVLELIEAYSTKTEQVCSELDELGAEGGICFTDEQWQYVSAMWAYCFYATVLAVSEQWDISNGVLRQQAAAAASRTERSKVALDDHQELYANKFAEMQIYLATVLILYRLLEGENLDLESLQPQIGEHGSFAAFSLPRKGLS